MAVIAGVSNVGDSFELGSDKYFLLADATFIPGECVLCPVNSDGSYTTCTAPTAASTGVVASAIASDGIFGIVVKGAVAGGYALVQLRGEVTAFTKSTADASMAGGGTFIPATGKFLEYDQGNGVTNAKWVALSLYAVPTASVDTTVSTLRIVWFDGINGFGRHGGSTS